MDEEPLSKEFKKQLIITAFALGTAISVYYLSGPDTIKTAKMWTALRMKRIAQWQVDMWQNVADRAATIYNREKI